MKWGWCGFKGVNNCNNITAISKSVFFFKKKKLKRRERRGGCGKEKGNLKILSISVYNNRNRTDKLAVSLFPALVLRKNE